LAPGSRRCRHTLVLSAIGCGNFEDADNQATAISPAGKLASHVPGNRERAVFASRLSAFAG